MTTRTPFLLAAAITALLAGNALAQNAETAASGAKIRTQHYVDGAIDAATRAREDARIAREAAAAAAADRRGGALTAEGAAQAEYSAWQAEQASRAADAAAVDAANAANRAGGARAATAYGTAQPTGAIAHGFNASSEARIAGNAANDAARTAVLAAGDARAAVNATPAPPPEPPASATYVPAEPLVTVNSLPPDSVVGEYRIDFATLDRDGNGTISRAEAAANPTLTQEFDAVDANRDGRLDRNELKGWMR